MTQLFSSKINRFIISKFVLEPSQVALGRRLFSLWLLLILEGRLWITGLTPRGTRLDGGIGVSPFAGRLHHIASLNLSAAEYDMKLARANTARLGTVWRRVVQVMTASFAMGGGCSQAPDDLNLNKRRRRAGALLQTRCC